MGTSNLVSKISLVLLSVGLVACQQQQAESALPENPAADPQIVQAEEYRQNIERVLGGDQQIGRSGQPSTAIATAMDQIELDGVPNDFRVAFVDHVYAWKQLGKIDDALTYLRSDQSMGEATIAGMAATIFGSEATPFTDQLNAIAELERRRPEFSEQVGATFQVVRRVAAGYGADIPRQDVMK